MERLGQERNRAGDHAGAEHAAARAAALGDVGGLLGLSYTHELGNRAGADRLARMAVAVGSRAALVAFARMCERRGQSAASERLRRFGLTEAGEPETQSL
jgi:hypothetical protein